MFARTTVTSPGPRGAILTRLDLNAIQTVTVECLRPTVNACQWVSARLDVALLHPRMALREQVVITRAEVVIKISKFVNGQLLAIQK